MSPEKGSHLSVLSLQALTHFHPSLYISFLLLSRCNLFSTNTFVTLSFVLLIRVHPLTHFSISVLGIIRGLSVSDIIDDKDPASSLVVVVNDGSQFILFHGIPLNRCSYKLQFHPFIIDGHMLELLSEHLDTKSRDSDKIAFESCRGTLNKTIDPSIQGKQIQPSASFRLKQQQTTFVISTNNKGRPNVEEGSILYRLRVLHRVGSIFSPKSLTFSKLTHCQIPINALPNRFRIFNSFAMNVTEEQLRHYVDNVFEKYDKNGNYTLDERELYHFFKDLFSSMNYKHNVTVEDARHSLKQIDANRDGKITKRELLNALKVMLGGNKPGTANKQPHLPYEHAKQPKHQEPPKQQHKHQQQAHHKPAIPRQQPPSNQAYQYHQQKPQQQKKPEQKQVRVQPQIQNQIPIDMILMQNVGMGMMGPGPFAMGPPGMGGPPGIGAFGLW